MPSCALSVKQESLEEGDRAIFDVAARHLGEAYTTNDTIIIMPISSTANNVKYKSSHLDKGTA